MSAKENPEGGLERVSRGSSRNEDAWKGTGQKSMGAKPKLLRSLRRERN
jgi:hypothetical protein